VSKLKHTPGPWEIIDHEEHSCFSILRGPKLNHYGRNVFCTHAIDITDEMREIQLADARLIAVAPEMLECLIRNYQDVLKLNKFLSSQMHHPYSLMENEIKNIIEKATGMKIKEIIE
jgi:hypothetical protein